MSEQPTADDWLRSLDPAVRRRLRAAEAVEEEAPPPTQRKVPDADQGMRGRPPGADKPRSADAWLMQLTDLGRGEGSADARYYDEVFGEVDE